MSGKQITMSTENVNRLFQPAIDSRGPSSRYICSFEIEDRGKEYLPPLLPFYKRIWNSKILMHYNRLAAIFFLINFYFLLKVDVNPLNMVLVNMAAALIIRQHYVINLLFKVFTSVPLTWPLWFRAFCGKVYHFAGIHFACGLSSIVWYIYHLRSLPSISIVDGSILFLLVLLPTTAFFRHKYHDLFERTIRFGGWSLLLLFIIQFAGQVAESSLPIFEQWQFYLIIALYVNAILPWLRLKKVKVNINTPSNHVALTEFNYGVTPFAGSSTSISRSPLFEWHSFANIPSPDKPGFRLAISRAGDWTGEFIDNPPKHVWVKAIPTAGVGNIEKLFKKVVFVATGSGIGPCLPHLLAGEVPSTLVWSTRSPEKTYGKEFVDEILNVQPNAVIWDTTEKGKPDMIELSYKAYKEFGAEAIIVISNKKLTWQVVTGMENRGIPTYGAIFDS